MKKQTSDAQTILKRLGKLSEFLIDLDVDAGKDERFDFPLEIIRKTMNFDVSVLYKVSNVIENRLILEVVKIGDPDNLRMDLKEGRKLRLFMDNRDRRYVNEVMAFINKRVSHINVPGMGCDIMGYVYLPESFGGAYLFGGDFCGKESSIKDYEVASMEVMCNFMSTILLKTRFEQQAEIDNLTGLFNSAKIKQKLENLLKRFERKKDAIACIAMGDIDYFKSVNDTYGHIQGDLVLKQVGEVFKSSLRGVFDVAGRYGGEEFLLILDDTVQADTFNVIERLRKKIEGMPIEKVDKTGRVIDGEFINVSMSFGVCEYKKTEEIQSAADWISRADSALYESKNAGRNRTTLYQGN